MYWKTTIIQSCISLIVLMLENPSSLTLRVNCTQIIMNYDTRPIDQTHQIFSSDHCQCCYSKYCRFDNQSNWTEICCIVLLSSTKIMTKYRRQRKLWRNIVVNENYDEISSSTKIMTKYRRQRTFITWRKRDETQRKCWSCDDDDN